MSQADLIIRNGTIIDGSGGPEKVSDIYNGLKNVHESVQGNTIESIIDKGLHEYVGDFIMNINNLDQNIQKQFF